MQIDQTCTADEYKRSLLFEEDDVCLPWLLCKTLFDVAKSKIWINADTELNLIQQPMQIEGEEESETKSCKFYVSNVQSMYNNNNEQTKNFPENMESFNDLRNLDITPWSAFHSKISNSDSFKSFLFRFPLVPGPSIDYSSISMALKQAQHVSV